MKRFLEVVTITGCITIFFGIGYGVQIIQAGYGFSLLAALSISVSCSLISMICLDKLPEQNELCPCGDYSECDDGLCEVCARSQIV
jgi:hypothetical protein